MSQPVLTPVPERNPADTKERLLAAAERLFAERGFDGTSMREITQAAGCSVSAANYHFGNKEALWSAVLRQRLAPMNRDRLAALERAVRASAGRPLALEGVFEAFFRPPIDQLAQRRRAGPHSFPRQVMARLYSEAPARAAALKAELFGEVTERFRAALGEALPGAGDDTLALIEQLSVASLVHVLSGQIAEGSLASEPDHEALVRALVLHAAAGARALATGARG